MTIKSLLIGSAALATASTGALAADAIVVPQPEPMEYVRICDVYGTGFFYIPGTETCLKIGGYYRTDFEYNVRVNPSLTAFTRFAPNFDVRTDTEVGTVRGYAEVELNWGFNAVAAPAAGAPGAYGVTMNLLHAYIEIVRPNGGAWLFGLTESPYSRFLGYGTTTLNDGYYGYNNTTEVSYTFTGSNGFSFIAALVNDQSVADFIPDAEIGLNFTRGWGSIGAMVGLDTDGAGGLGIGAKASLVVNFPNTNGSFFKLMAMYTSDPAGVYGFDYGGGATGNLSVLAGLNLAFSQKVALALTAQWFSGGQFLAAAALPISFTDDFVVTPEVGFDTVGGNVVGAPYAIVRLQRNF